MNIITVTCLEDYKDLVVQIKSLDLFWLEPTRHIVVVEDGSISNPLWSQLSSTRHTIEVVEGPGYANLRGWVRQQILKLWVAEHVDSLSYLVLDSKNFFIKPISAWPFAHGNGQGGLWDPAMMTEDSPSFYPFALHASRITGKDIPARVWAPVTPFVVTTDIARNILREDIGAIFAFDKPSEFILYSFWDTPTEADARDPVHLTFWPNSAPFLKDSLEKDVPEQVVVLALHRDNTSPTTRFNVAQLQRQLFG